MTVAVDIAVRAYPIEHRARRERRDPGPPSGIVVALDCETRTTGVDQRLLFGSVRVYAASGRLIEESLIAADNLTPAERGVLEEYRRTHRDERGRPLRLVNRQPCTRRCRAPSSDRQPARSP